MRLKILCILFIFCGYASAQETQLQFSRLDLSNGLSNNQVTAIHKDSKGYMWFGTMAGLNRYDGYQFKVFKHNSRNPNTLSDDFINNVAELPHSKLLIDTRAGLNIFDLEKQSIVQNVNPYFKSLGISTSAILNVKKDKTGNFWFNAGNDGIYIYQTDNKKTVHLKCSDNGILGKAPVSDIQNDTNGNIYVLHTDKTFEQFDAFSLKLKRRFIALKFKEPIDFKPLRFFIDKDGGVFIWSFNDQENLTYYAISTNQVKFLSKKAGGLNSNLITGIIQDDNGAIWIGTDHGGINILDEKNFEINYVESREDDPKTLSQNSVVSMYKDNTGIIWVGTFKKGVSYYHQNIIKFPLYKHLSSNKNSLPYDDVNRFIEDDKGNIWIGTNGHGLIYYDRKNQKYLTYKHNANDVNSISNDIVVSLFIDDEKKLWIGTYFGGLDRFDGKNFKHYRHDTKNTNSIGDDRIWDIIEGDDKKLWIGTLGAGIDVLDRTSGIFTHYKAYQSKNSVASNFVTALLKDKYGNAYIGTSVGLDFWEKKTNKFTHFNADPQLKNSLSNGNVYDILEDSYGYIWITTRDGLNRYNPKTKHFDVFRIENGLPDNTTLNIVEDKNKNLWVSSTKGLTFIKVKNNGKSFSFSFRNYDQQDGLQGKEFNVNSAYLTKKGELIFGGANGFNMFKPEAIKTDHSKPEIALSDLQIANKSIAVDEELNGDVILEKTLNSTTELSLNHQNNVVSIEFTALNYFNPDKIKYKYMLEGFDKTWQEPTGNLRRATYTNLDPGNYTFKVYSTNAAGDWVANEKRIAIEILPPFWKTPLAYVLYLATIGGALFLVRQRGIRKLKTEFAIEQERREAKRMHELDLMKIKFFTNISHEFRTPLSLIITPMEKLIKQTEDSGRKQQMQMIHRNGRRLLNMVNQLLDFRRMEVQQLKLDFKLGDIVDFIKDLTHSFSDIAEKKNIEFSFQSDLTNFITEFDYDKIERILFNLLSNAFKFTPEGGKVEVQLGSEVNQYQETLLLISVSDSGIGIENDKLNRIFDRFFQSDIPGSLVNQGSGIGLSITKEFVRLHGGDVTAESSVGIGSTFIVKIPFNEAKVTIDENSKLSFTVKSPLNAVFEDKHAATLPEFSKKPVLLLVEDNDDFRFYLKDNLNEYYLIFEASNGKEGWQKVLSHHPDLVVSDVSMPEMNGIDLCKKIKTDKRTANTPVILLTALTGEEMQISGLETGANDYVMKPFNFEILLFKIKNQLTQIKSSEIKYKKQVDINPKTDEIESVDEKFMRQLTSFIESNVSNAEYSVDQLSGEMNMSRVSLYKKVLLLTGKSPVEYIRFYRLKKSIQLLEKSQLTISEIAYEVGFNNPKYFTKYFKQEFNMLPSAYVLQKTKKN
ncbi:hybrid sensor histidine kinase/response regulator transcription factor [Pedobacter jejuensis]|uniref:histidine kinase n=1 Tax=Pedobacter jejuensis TaxID=1268550 RepID=A0A3N0C383_9SPHI|nr:hybrid sensor histidine kinase/response regulator transcription factor [Pedobacter jejuensis]RNL56645.1 hybrid sensor histidine kinase/response regulator [Pedobacter jejuensis]